MSGSVLVSARKWTNKVPLQIPCAEKMITSSPAPVHNSTPISVVTTNECHGREDTTSSMQRALAMASPSSLPTSSCSYLVQHTSPSTPDTPPPWDPSWGGCGLRHRLVRGRGGLRIGGDERRRLGGIGVGRPKRRCRPGAAGHLPNHQVIVPGGCVCGQRDDGGAGSCL